MSIGFAQPVVDPTARSAAAAAMAAVTAQPVDTAGVLTLGGNSMGRVLAQSSSASNAVRMDRPAGTAYQLSASRAGRVQVSVTLKTQSLLAVAQTATAALQVGPDEAGLVEQGAEGDDIALGILTPIRTQRRMLYADVPPGHYYKVVLTQSGGGTATLNYVKERVF